MPNVPVYERKEVGGVSSPRLGDPESKAKVAFGESVFKMGTTLRKQGEKLQERRDLIDAMEATNDFRDSERSYLDGEIKNRARDARGGTKRGVEFYDKEIPKYQEALKTDRARFLFGKLTLADRESGLNKLAQHESVQERAIEKQVAEKAIEGAVQNVIFSAGDQESVDKVVALAKADIDTLAVYQGQDKEYLKSKLERNLLTAQIEELNATRPAKAWKLLQTAKYQKALGENLATLQKANETATTRMIETQTEQGLKQKFGTTKEGYNKMFDWLSKPSNYDHLPSFTARSAQWLYNKLEAEQTHQRAYEEIRRKNSENDGLKAVFNRHYAGDTSGALDILRENEDINAEVRFRVENSLTKAIWQTDPAVDSKVIEDIMGGRITHESEIYSQQGHGLSGPRARSLVKFWQTQQGNLSATNYISLARKKYKKKWQSVSDYESGSQMELYEDDFIRTLQWHITKENLQGDDIAKKADELMGTIEEALFDKIDSPFQRMAKFKSVKYPWEVEAEVFRRTDDIPRDIRDEIVGGLIALARQDPDMDYLHYVTEANIRHSFRKYYPEQSRNPLVPAGE